MQHQSRLAICYTSSSHKLKAQELAKELNLPLKEQEEQHHYDFLLAVSDHYLSLHTMTTRSKPFYIDFQSGKIRYRYQQIHHKKELLAKAIGGKQHFILDTTAGLGQDSFILAALGHTITALERSPILYALLQDALQRAGKHQDLKSTVSRLHLIHADSITWLLKHRGQKPDIIYLDPMFPDRKKTALAKKEMVILQTLLGQESDAEQLFELALTCASHRVVVKRPRLAKTLGNKKPNFAQVGSSSRFDVYLV